MQTRADMDQRDKLATGAVLSTVGGLGIILNPILGWGQLSSPWSFLLGFVFGAMAGVGVVLALGGLVDRRRTASAKGQSE
jgi:NhaP-type Na+/H+ or K+/H+ antiporter